jgi:hypothetical protein
MTTDVNNTKNPGFLPSAVKFEMTPAVMARRPFQKVAEEKVTPFHSSGKP